ncbi:MAG: lysophospholipid acyltransferase family protein [Eubacteriales bacterium]|nr:lysophospholipid acyltransferase family protein [Eubacteriales bacterium]
MEKTLVQRIFYRICVLVAHVIIPLLHPLKIYGAEPLPDEPFIFCANHVSVWDCIFMAYMVLPRRTAFMAKAELFDNKMLKWIITTLGAFPVKRGTADTAAIKNALQALKGGSILIIYPEGTRNRNWQGTLQPFNKGTGFLALMSKAPVIPMFFSDVHGFKPFRKVHIHMGRPVNFGDSAQGAANSEKTALITQKIYDDMTKLLTNAPNDRKNI